MKNHKFVASWGEFGLLLEDVAVLTSLPLFGDADGMELTLEADDQKRLEFLHKALSDSRNSANKATYLSWVKFFKDGEGRHIKFQVEAPMAYLLLFFLFPR